MKPSAFARALEARARSLGRSIAFPEADDPRVVAAARRLAERGVVEPRLVRDGGDPLVRAAEMLARGEVDGVVAGAVRSSADVIRAGLRHVGLRSGVETLSGCFFMEVAGFRGPSSEVLVFADAGVTPEPGARALAEIARECVRIRRLVVRDEPVVAFLSYSTLGSAAGPSVERMRRAHRLFRRLEPEVAADGELQADAALVPEVAAVKAPDSPVGGRANVLAFPSLDAGNVAYKLVQRLAGARALGPVLLGLRAPLNDLSRGATTEDVAHVAAITALMAENS